MSRPRPWSALLIGLAVTAISATATAEVLPEPSKVSPNAWAWIGPHEVPTAENRGFRMNLGFVVGTDAVAVIDSGYTPAMAKQMLEQIRAITPLPIRYVINTNSQPHRVLGNEVFRAEGAEVVTASACAVRMAEHGAAFAETAASIVGVPPATILPPAAPDRLLDEGDTLTLALGADVELMIENFGRSHTPGSLGVLVMPDAIMFAGDILYGERLPGVLPDGHVGDWIEAFDRLRNVDAQRFVPGHGQPGVLEDFEHPTYEYVVALKEHMDRAVDEGLGLDEAIPSFDGSRWSELELYDVLAGRNANIAYLESEAEGF